LLFSFLLPSPSPPPPQSWTGQYHQQPLVVGRNRNNEPTVENGTPFRKRFQDKPLISFTDLTSMATMPERGITRVLTENDHCLQVGMGFQKVP
jgi:hypothetical protein